MNIWNKIDEPVMRAVSGIVFDIYGTVGFSIDYDDNKHEIELVIWDKSYKSDDKKVVVNNKFNYEISDTKTHTVLAIVEMIEKYLIENFT